MGDNRIGKVGSMTRIAITVTPQVAQALDALLNTGLFGFSRADVARRLVDAGVRDNIDFTPSKRRRR
jgi:hypothetical protein